MAKLKKVSKALRLPRGISFFKSTVIILFTILTFFPALTSLLEAQVLPERPSTNYLPQISVPVVGGGKVNTWNGNYFLALNLLSLPARGLSINLSLSYNSSWYASKTNYGYGWQSSYNDFYKIQDNGDIVVVWEDGRSETFTKSGTTYLSPKDTYDNLELYETNKVRVTTKSGMIYLFENATHKNVTKISEPNGNSLVYSYNADNLVSDIKDSSNRSIGFEYTEKKLTKITDANVTPSRIVEITYDTNDNLTQVKDPMNNLMKFEYNKDHLMTKVTDAKDNYAVLVYSNGLLVSANHNSGAASYITYDSANYITTYVGVSPEGKQSTIKYYYLSTGKISKIDQIKDQSGGVLSKTFVWDDNNNLTEVTDENSNKLKYTYDSKGNILTVTDAMDKVTTYTYDSVFNKVTSVKDAKNNTTVYGYDTKGNLLTVTDPYNNTITYTYDTNGDLLTAKDAKNNVTTYQYNSYGYQTTETNALGKTVTKSYDNVGKLLSVSDPLGATVNYEYDTNGNKLKDIVDVSNLNIVTSYTYDAVGNLTKVVDAENHKKDLVYDSAGRLVKEIDNANKETIYNFDKNTRSTSIVDAMGNVTNYYYDYLGRLVSETDADGKTIFYEYDNVGNLVKKIDANGDETTYTYNKNYNVTKVHYADGTETSYEYDDVGNVTKTIGASATVTNVYDKLNRVTETTTATGTISKTVKYSYYENGLRKTMTDPDTGVTNYDYDFAGQLTTITNPQNEVTKYSYDDAGKLTKRELGNSSFTEYAYDTADRLTSLTNKKSGGTVISSFSYTYDKVGNKLTTTANGEVISYQYDAMYRISNVDYPGSDYEIYTYDDVGNRLSLETLSGNTNYTYDDTNKLQLGGEIAYQWDNNGNNTRQQNGSEYTYYSYNKANQLTSVTLPDNSKNEFTYYPDGRRLSYKDKAGNTKYYFYDGENVLAETDSAGTTSVRYTSNGTDEWLSIRKDNATNYYLKDGIGSVTNLVDGTGNVVNSYKYSTFGNITNQTGTAYNNFTYTGREKDESGLYYYRARYFDPTIGRFTQKDPAGMTDGTNMYMYAGNNPLRYIDISGTTNYDINETQSILTEAKNKVKNAGSLYDKYLQAKKQHEGCAEYDYKCTSHNDTFTINTNDGQRVLQADQFGNYIAGYATAQLPFGISISHFAGDIFELSASLRLDDPGSTVCINQGAAAYKGNSVGTCGITQGYKDDNDRTRRDRRDRTTDRRSFTLIRSASAYSGGGAGGVKEGTKGGYYAKSAIVIGNVIYYIPDYTEWTNPGGGGGGGSGEQARLFGKSDYTDFRLGFNAGEESNAPDRGAWYKSLYLPSGWSAYLYDHPIGQAGREECFSGSSDQLESKGWANSIDAVKISSTNICSVAQSYVTICTETGHNGNCKDVTSDQRSLGNFGFGNDTLKSIYIAGDWDVLLFEDDNYGGRWYQTNSTNGDLGGIPFGYNTSSMQVRKTNPAAFSLYKLGDFNDGGPFRSDRSINNLENWKADSGSWNDRTQSIRVSSGYEIVACTDASFRGNCGRTTTDKANIDDLAQGLRNGLSSVQVCKGTCPAAPTTPIIAAPVNNEIFLPGTPVIFTWTGDGQEYYVEYWGGDMATPKTINVAGATTTVVTSLPVSANPYYWHVRGWNPYGSSPTSQTYSFKIQDVNLTGVILRSIDSINLNQDLAITAKVIPSNATSLTYTWAPTPKSGAGTPSVIYNFNTTGKKDITLTVSNASGSVIATKQINVGCLDGKFLAEYFDNKTLSGNPVISRCEASIDYNWSDSSPDTSLLGSPQFIGDGRDGDLIVSAGQTAYTDNVRTILTSNASTGTKSLVLSSASGFNANDEILIIQSKGTGTGNYESNKIVSISGNTLTLQNTLVKSYTTSQTQVIRIPQYKKVRISGTLSAHAWDGNTGGIIAFKASEGITLEGGTIDATGKGYRGGARTYGKITSGIQGEYRFGMGGTSRSPVDNAGGGGPGTGDGGAAGGGGSYATGGGNAGDPFYGDPGLGATTIYGDADLNTLFFGGAGGSGGTDDSGWDGSTYGGRGGNGGGIIFIQTSVVDGSGSIKSNGETGEDHQVGEHGGGGGGAGGSIKLLARSLNSANIAITTGGGSGGAAKDGRGGSGGSGITKLLTCSTNMSCTFDNFSARWTKATNFGGDTYKFIAKADDGIKLFVDGTLQIDKWIDGYNETTKEVTLNEGAHEVKVEYYENTGNALVSLNIIPNSNTAPVFSPIPNQTIETGNSFVEFDLDDYVTDSNGDLIKYTFSGNIKLQVTIDAENKVNVIAPVDWKGTEEITFTATDIWGESASKTVSFKISQCPQGQFLAEYFDNKDLNGSPVVTRCEDSIDYNWELAGPNVFAQFGNGIDGDLTISQNTTDNPIDSQASGATGTNTLNATNAGFQAGQKILIHQTKGTSAGTYQITEIVSYTNGVITTKDALEINYSSTGANRAQVLVIKQYANVTINNGARLIAKEWNGITGGILTFFAKNTVQVDGTISVDGTGFRGGVLGANIQMNGIQGEGINSDGVSSISRNDNGGGGGAYGTNGTSSSAGGAGGGNLNNGDNGENNIKQQTTGGTGGITMTNTSSENLHFGGAGGSSGGINNSFSDAGDGGDAGGIAIIFAKNLQIGSTGVISSNGMKGQDGGGDTGGAGGGAGGNIYLKVDSGNIGSSLIKTLGGSKGLRGGDGGQGGAGSAGRLYIDYCSQLSGNASNLLSTQVTCIGNDKFSVRWSGSISFAAGTYKFETIADDGVKLSVDGVLQINEWLDGYYESSKNVELTTGIHDIELEYYENTGNAQAKLSWALGNSAPSDIELSAVSIEENKAIGTEIGALTSTDIDSGDTFTYTLVSGTGSEDNTNFTIVGDKLKTAASFDFEIKNSQNIRIRSTDQDGEYFEKEFTIGVTDVNEGPTDLKLSTSNIIENNVPGTEIGEWISTDPDAGDAFTYTLVSGVGSNDNSMFTIENGKLKAANSFDFETKNIYMIRARTTDKKGLFFEKALVISVEDINEVPVLTTIPGQTIDEDGIFEVINLNTYGSDADIGDTLTWTVSGNTDLEVVTGTDNKVTITAPENWNGTEAITFRVTDQEGLYAEKSAEFIVNAVNDIPVITSTAITTAGVDRSYIYQVLATDVDSPTLVYALTTAPTGMVINTTGKITWTPVATNIGNNNVVVEVSDGTLKATQTFVVAVSYNAEDFIVSLDDKDMPISNWKEDSTVGFAISNENEALKVQTSLNKNAKKELTLSQWINVEVGKKYYFAANISSVKADSPKVLLKLYDANFTLLGTAKTITATAGTKSWTEYRTTYTIPAKMANKSVKYAKVTLMAGDRYSTTTVDAVTYFDDIYFSKNGRPYTAAFTVTPATIKEGDTVTLKAGTSTDPDANKVFTYLWEQVSGPTITITNSTSKIATFIAPADVDKDYTVTVRLTVGDGLTVGMPREKIINVIGILDTFNEEFTSIDRWTNSGTANFSNSLDGETMLVSALKSAVTSNIVTTQYIKIENVDQKLTFRIKSENAKSFAITMTGYSSTLAATGNTKTCTVSGFTGTKDWTEYTCDINTFRLKPANKYVKITLKFTSASKTSKLWIDYVKLNAVGANIPPVITTIPGQTINQGDSFTTIDLKNYATDQNAGDILSWSVSGNSNLTINIDSNKIATITYLPSWSGEESVTFTVKDTALASASSTAVFKVVAVPFVWVKSETMPTARHGQTLTKLQNGKLLVAGGWSDSNQSVVNCEIYDPVNNTWAVTGNLNAARTTHTASLLANGKVLVTGGINASGTINSAEIYDPATGVWTLVPSLNTARYSHTASLLPNGKVMVVGGFAPGSYDAPTEIYDPTTNTWSLGVKPTTGRGEHSATTLPDGRIMIIGGYRGPVLTSAEIFNPTTNTWTTVASMANVRTRHTATLLPNGKILVAGGWNGNMTNSAEMYDIASNTWTPLAGMPTNHSDQTAEYVNGKVFIIGGSSANDNAINNVEIFDTATNKWTIGPALNTARRWHRSTVVGTKIIVTGGATVLPSPGDLKSIETIAAR